MRSFAIEEPGSPVPALYATLAAIKYFVLLIEIAIDNKIGNDDVVSFLCLELCPSGILLYFHSVHTNVTGVTFHMSPMYIGTNGSMSPGRGKWSKCGIFSFFLELCCD